MIHFGYSEIKKVAFNKFGPSVVRLYKQLCNFDERLFSEMVKLGEVLGAGGFVTISCIQSFDDGKRYFIEADMRPNSWIEFTKFIGDDGAIRVEKWFSRQEKMSYPFVANHDYPMSLLTAYFSRMSFWEIFFNRYGVWKFMSREDLRIFLQKFYSYEFANKILIKIKRAPTNLIHFVMPLKEQRYKVKRIIKQSCLMIKDSRLF